ncbi:DUF1654 domain-containing protein [Modicisalibacter coralii]|uniref:DUF1654 domain-containing protein n=1 Tax=Modicisalibacter coralii TaxID=2304602 RepID=UPI00100B75C2|nr:DUF1654 domain-containing protein [Halomonas coralii]
MSNTSYERLGHRIQRAVTSPAAVSRRQITLERQPDESQEDWDQILDEIDTNEHVAVTRIDDDTASLRWNPAESGA